MEKLSPLPRGVRPLSTTESARLNNSGASSWAYPETNCLTCSDKRSFIMRRGDDLVEVECDCTDQWLMHRYMLNAGIGTAYQRLSWHDVSDTVPMAAIDLVLGYADDAVVQMNAGRGLILHGPQGTGKTLLGILLLKSLLARGIDAYFSGFTDVIDAYASGWRSVEEKAWFARRVRNVDLLMIDDVGREHSKAEMVESMFDEVIRSRHANAKPTIITTNLTMDQVRQGYGPNVMSLLTEKSGSHEITGEDFRPQARQRLEADIRGRIVKPIVMET